MQLLNNVEFMLMQIICDNGELSGYEINQIVEERGYRAWADIGTTSIYVSLEKLRKKGLVECHVDIDKQGKGPLPKKFQLTDQGYQFLIHNIKESLSTTRERDKRFDLGVAACHLITLDEILSALSKRRALLSTAKEAIEKKYSQQRVSDLPINVQYLFLHPIYLINCELDFVNDFMKKLQEQEENR